MLNDPSRPSGTPTRTMLVDPQSPRAFPYNLPIWRTAHAAASPDGTLLATVDPAIERSMGNPTFGTLRVQGGPETPSCSPAFLWSDDSRFLAVPQYRRLLVLEWKARLLLIDVRERRVWATKNLAWFLQPELFERGALHVRLEPFRTSRVRVVHVPAELGTTFRPLSVAWPDASDGSADAGEAARQ